VKTTSVPKALVTGAAGQLGQALLATAPAAWEVVGCGADALDITQPDRVEAVLDRERPALILHAAAYTRVDAAEADAERAHAINAAGAAHVAENARRLGARLIYVSTDFVFDGTQGRPYTPDDLPNPLNVYGRTKLAGERAVARILGDAALIVRTAWVYSASGHNFAQTMLRLMRERDAVGVVSDQVGSPTWAHSLAVALWVASDRTELRGVHQWTDAGVASWYDFAVAIQEEALALGLLTRAVPVRPLRTDEYPTPARRPPYSVLDTSRTAAALGLPARHWRANLRQMLQGLKRA
jgi:dTDP-4-dehydrorhamnose reductase